MLKLRLLFHLLGNSTIYIDWKDALQSKIKPCNLVKSIEIIEHSFYIYEMKNTILFLCILFTQTLGAQTFSTKVIPAAEIVDEYYNLIKNKRVAVLVNQTSVIHQTHLVDSLLHRGINIVKIFAPEHGFRGTENAGEDVKNSVDIKTGLAISSMYGATKKPTAESMQNAVISRFVCKIYLVAVKCRTKFAPLLSRYYYRSR